MIYTPPPQSLWVFLEVSPPRTARCSHFHTMIYTPSPQSLRVFLEVSPPPLFTLFTLHGDEPHIHQYIHTISHIPSSDLGPTHIYYCPCTV